MKKTREGTLVRFHDAGNKKESFQERIARMRSAGAILGMADFLEKADELVAEMSLRGEVSKTTANELKRAVAMLREALADGIDKNALYNAVGAGLTFANLCNEKRDDDAKTSKGGKPLITRRRYYAAVRKVEATGNRVTLERIAEILNCSAAAVGKWKGEFLRG